MRVEQVQVELRPRSAWEAMELGNALVRRHARAIWLPLLALGLPLLVLLNALGWALDQLWLAALLMWWITPLLDRIPLFVLSRAVFGEAPSVATTLQAQRHWGWSALWGHLTWRRFSPRRSVVLPVDFLEGLQGAALTQRRSLLAHDISGHAALLTVLCQLFVVVLLGSLVALIALLIPNGVLMESAEAFWILVSEQPPRWVQLLANLGLAIATWVIEPFHIGAGFGLYLNRRSHLEAWDLEIAFRRLRARLVPASTLVLGVGLALAMLAPWQAAHAQSTDQADTSATTTWTPGGRQRTRDRSEQAGRASDTLPRVFGRLEAGESFTRAVGEAYADPLLGEKRRILRWQPREKDQQDERAAGDERSRAMDRWNPDDRVSRVIEMVALIAEYGLWVVVASVVGILLFTVRRWWPWMRGALQRTRAPVEIRVEPAPPLPEALPEDLLATVRRLWHEGRRRRALALLYRGSVEAMVARAGVTLVPGATEAQCLRASRRLPDAADREAFAAVVGVWQRAAYGQRLPDDAALDALLAQLAPRFGWSS